MGRVSVGYQDYLQSAYSNLTDLYGERTNPQNCMAQYQESAEAKLGCRVVTCCEDMPILTKDDILRMIRQDEAYTNNVQRFLELYGIFDKEF